MRPDPSKITLFRHPTFMSQATAPLAPLSNKLLREANCRGVDTGMLFQNAAQQGRCARAYMDVFTAVLKQHTGGRAASRLALEND